MIDLAQNRAADSGVRLGLHTAAVYFPTCARTCGWGRVGAMVVGAPESGRPGRTVTPHFSGILDIALGAGGRRFESSRPDQLTARRYSHVHPHVQVGFSRWGIIGAMAPKRTQDRPLTDLQRAFAYHLVFGSLDESVPPRERCWTAAEVARRAGYSSRNGNDRRLGYKARWNPRVRAEIRRLAEICGKQRLFG